MELKNEKDLEELYNKNEALIHYTIHKYFLKKKNILYDYDDLYQLGSLALWKACKTFDELKGYKFSTYAIRVIYNEISCELRKIKNKLDSLYLYSTVGENDEYLIDKIASYTDTNDISNLINTINKVFDEASDKDKIIFKNKLKNLSEEAIGKILGITQSAVNKRVHKLYNKIREKNIL